MRKKLYQPNYLVIFGSYNNLGLMQRGANQPEINELLQIYIIYQREGVRSRTSHNSRSNE